MTPTASRILLAAITATTVVPATIAAVAFNTLISRARPLDAEAAADADAVSATMADARRTGRDWLAATAHQRWQATAHDGTPLVAHYIPSPTPTTKAVALIHGHRADATLMGPFARDYHAADYHVFIADLRAHGASGGRYVGMGWLDHLDHLRWLDQLTATVGHDADIVVHGLSMGAATALMLSASPDLPHQVRAVVADCSFTSAYDELAYHLRRRHLPAAVVTPIVNMLTRGLAGYWLTQASPLSAIAHARVPVLLIHGDADEYNPTAMAHELSAAAPNAPLWLVPGADHGMSYFTDPDAYRNHVNQFLDTHLPHHQNLNNPTGSKPRQDKNPPTNCDATA